jgi:hypothetical protein
VVATRSGNSRSTASLEKAPPSRTRSRLPSPRQNGDGQTGTHRTSLPADYTGKRHRPWLFFGRPGVLQGACCNTDRAIARWRQSPPTYRNPQNRGARHASKLPSRVPAQPGGGESRGLTRPPARSGPPNPPEIHSWVVCQSVHQHSDLKAPSWHPATTTASLLAQSDPQASWTIARRYVMLKKAAHDSDDNAVGEGSEQTPPELP